MILPNKYIPIEESMIGLGAIALRELAVPLSVTTLWRKMMRNPRVATYDRFVLTLDFLFMVNAIDYTDGLIRRRSR